MVVLWICSSTDPLVTRIGTGALYEYLIAGIYFAGVLMVSGYVRSGLSKLDPLF
jgi:hypothetical protein